jgi:TolB-like protein/DNA-binding winged helix-turn-helix (wHTH) protein/Flp pilus assembly protein TadD
MQRSLLKGFYLQDLLIEPSSGRVTGPEGESHLKPKAVEVLLYLAQRPFELVERDDLLEAVWGADRGTPEALSHAVSELRHGLSDQADAPKVIQTVPRRGYRLLRQPRFVEPPDIKTSADAPRSRDEGGFVGKLMRRGVVQAGLAYLVFAWLLIQVADAVTPILDLPAWFPAMVTYAAIVGFPIVLILAWLLEQGDGRWFLDRGKQSGKMLSGLERNYLSIIVAYGIAAIGAYGYQVLVGFDVTEVPESTVAIEDSLLPVKPNSIAVLKFLNISGDQTAKAFSEGLGEDLLDRLARIPGLSVSSRGDSWSLPMNASSELVRQRLRVAYFLEGSVRVIGDDLKVVVQLIESATGFHVFSRSFDAKLDNFMDVQREITSLAVANLRVALPENESLLADEPDPDPDAYVLYRHGRALLHQPAKRDLLLKAIDYFEQALQLDSGYSAAHSGICEARVTLYRLERDDSDIGRARAACAAALDANPNLYMVYTALGELHLTTGGHSAAEDAFGRSLDINGNGVQAMRGIAKILQRKGQVDEAEGLLQRAIDLQPGNWRNIDALGFMYFTTGRYEKAANQFRRVAFLDPGNWQGHGNLGSALMMAGEFAAALDAIQTSLQIEERASQRSNLATIYYYLGEFDRSVEIHRQTIETMPESHFVWLNLGDSLRFSSQPGQAEQAYRHAAELSRNLLAVNFDSPVDLMVLAWSTASLGDTAEARQLIDRALDLSPDDPYVRYYDGLLRNYSGEKGAAVESLRQAVAGGYPVAMLAADPLLQGLHGDKGFERLLEEGAATAL